MKLKKGMKMKVIQGIKQTHRHAWIETGDIVTVKEIYDHVVLVERPYHNPWNGMMRECYRLNEIDKYLKPV